MKLFNTLLRKIKYNLRYLFGAKISIPSEFKLFERRKTNYEKKNRSVILFDRFKMNRFILFAFLKNTPVESIMYRFNLFKK